MALKTPSFKVSLESGIEIPGYHLSHFADVLLIIFWLILCIDYVS